jgi:hypothetical protein
MSSPESELRYAVPNHADPSDTVHYKPTFELRPGPTDVVAFHDFHSLQMAFENVWTELVDDRVSALGRQLYQEYVQLKSFAGVDDGTDPTIASIGDLKALMDEIRDFTRLTVASVPAGLKPAGNARGADGPKPVSGSNDVGTNVANGVVDVLLPGVRQVYEELSGSKYAVAWTDLDPKNVLPKGDTIGYTVDAHSSLEHLPIVEMGLDAATGRHGRLKTIVFTNPSLGNFQLGATAQGDSSTTITLASALVAGGKLEFQRRDDFGYFRGVYVLSDVETKLPPGSRVTFTWMDA